ncbi:MAG: hypothetical protein ACI9TH_004191 [Kiritimatiellia bacterium]|jgi:hypothetical protein
MSTMKTALLILALGTSLPAQADTHIRFKLHEPDTGSFHLELGGFIHTPPWYLPKGRVPEAKDVSAPSGEWTEWFNLTKWAGEHFHGTMDRAGGIAELPNMTLDIRCSTEHPQRDIEIELADAPKVEAVRKRFRERFTGSKTSLLISPDVKKDADQLETASEMSGRRLAWAREASKGKRVSPEHHILQTSMWSPQRSELQEQELETLSLLGFNIVGNKSSTTFPELREPGHTHSAPISPATTREEIEANMKKVVEKLKRPPAAGLPFGFSDEICARPPIGEHVQARKHFTEWLAKKKITPETLGVKNLSDVIPLETPEALKAAMAVNEAAARRVFYYTSIFRQKAGTDRLKWNTEAFHKYAGEGPLTSSLVADHPYFGGTGLGMGMIPNTAWGGAPLALDWFDLARRRAVDLIGIEDWMGLQYMYGPNYTWEGFQLMGFQSAMMRSGAISGGGPMPIIAWITPSDETNFRLKAASALSQGAKHFFFWTYGPTNTSTENYWSDIRGAYDGVATLARHLAFSEPIIHAGQLRPTRIAILYSISSDLWQPFGYVHMLERRCAYLAFVHAQHRVDFVTEDDIEAGRLANYDVLWTSDPCIRTKSAEHIRAWANKPAHRLIGSCGAGHFNEFGEPVDALASTFGFDANPARTWTIQEANYRVRGGLNSLPVLHKDDTGLEWSGLDWPVNATKVRHAFENAHPAVIATPNTTYFCGTPALSYARAAKFVPTALAEKWPADWRTQLLSDVQIPPPVLLSHPVVEAGLYENGNTAALVLGNFTYHPIDALSVECQLAFKVRKVQSAEQGDLDFTQSKGKLTFKLPLGISDLIRVE